MIKKDREARGISLKFIYAFPDHLDTFITLMMATIVEVIGKRHLMCFTPLLITYIFIKSKFNNNNRKTGRKESMRRPQLGQWSEKPRALGSEARDDDGTDP